MQIKNKSENTIVDIDSFELAMITISIIVIVAILKIM